jgi:hypothetical protein
MGMSFNDHPAGARAARKTGIASEVTQFSAVFLARDIAC